MRRKSNWAQCPRCHEEWWVHAGSAPAPLSGWPDVIPGCRLCRSRPWRWLAPRANWLGGRRSRVGDIIDRLTP
jgi:hypothetical protein